ncbi:uncharacterized protein LOC116526325 [Sapajus apella]|uniref:Uncharacterized protein LOC116526325 n=1 Tax=Sapajus apella TaxID=9515 RepID=A0A6J3EYY3_SAPAP|nr:uncharacterized protein LOC116526325 [Sapajus apella]
MRSGAPSLKTEGERETGFRRTRSQKEVTRGHRSSGGGPENVSEGGAGSGVFGKRGALCSPPCFLEAGAAGVEPGRLAVIRATTGPGLCGRPRLRWRFVSGRWGQRGGGTYAGASFQIELFRIRLSSVFHPRHRKETRNSEVSLSLPQIN